MNSSEEWRVATNERTSKQLIVMRKDLGMRKGKMVAQGAHAAVAWLTNYIRSDGDQYISEAEKAWIEGAFTKICVSVNSEEELLDIHQQALDAGLRSILIQDAGLTEFGGVPTYTCCGIGPDWNDKIDAVCGKLPLL